MSYYLYAIFGIIPSLAWLLFYLRKDSHPESNGMVLKIFFYGVIIALPVVLIEMGIADFGRGLNLSFSLNLALNMFLGVAFVEEFVKYLVIRGKVLRSHEFDEPIDTVLYMIIAALGFAAVENVLILFSLGPVFLLKEAFSISVFRFLGATFLHALCSGTLGYFLAISICNARRRFFLLGLIITVFLHGLYNFSIIGLEGELSFFIPAAILISLALFLNLGFKRLKKLKSICHIKDLA